jgi:hypothetical protein
MTRAELESKHIAELHELAAEKGVERYRMLPREELIAELAGDSGDAAPRGERKSEPRARREPRQRRERREPARREPGRREPEKREETAPSAAPPARSGGDAQPGRKRRRRRFGRRGRKTLRVPELLLPAASGRQAIVYAETREACTALLRELAAELSGGRGPDPVALLVDPSPEELADWKREAPKAEIVSAGQERHAEDALAQAARRAEAGESVIFLIDSLSRLAEEFGGAGSAKELFDAGLAAGGTGGGSLTVVAAVVRPD